MFFYKNSDWVEIFKDFNEIFKDFNDFRRNGKKKNLIEDFWKLSDELLNGI